MGNRVYYSRTKITDNEDGTQNFKSYIQSVNLSGKDKKTHNVFKDAKDITLEGDGRYLYSSVSLKKDMSLALLIRRRKSRLTTNLSYMKKSSMNRNIITR